MSKLVRHRKCPKCGYDKCYFKAPICENCEYEFRPIDRVADSILNRCRKNEVAVVTARNGLPGKVYGLEEYLKMKDLPHQHKPHTFRNSGRVKSAVTLPLV